jgi:GTP-binding protein
LEANEEQMDYPTLYASAREGWALRKRGDPKQDLKPLFEAIVNTVPAPVVNTSAPFSMLVSAIETDQFLGRYTSSSSSIELLNVVTV